MALAREKEFFIDNLLVRIHFIIVMIRWTGLAPWEFEGPRDRVALPRNTHPVQRRHALGPLDSSSSQHRWSPEIVL